MGTKIILGILTLNIILYSFISTDKLLNLDKMIETVFLKDILYLPMPKHIKAVKIGMKINKKLINIFLLKLFISFP